MGLKLERKTLFTAKTDRVKSLDFHPIEPWLLVSLYNGQVAIWNYNNQSLVKTFEVTDFPVRNVRFISRKNWFVCGADDLQIRVFNYNTSEKVIAVDAHTDYIRSLAVHPTKPFILSSSDDMTIKLWDWEKGWKCIMTYEGHYHYVMSVVFNPKDSNTFASASLDRTIKVWNLGSPTPNYTLEGHEKGVNCLDYCQSDDKPYLISGADDKTVKVWDYQNKSCVQTLEGHSQNVTVAVFHPELPIIITGSEDHTVKIWNSNTYRLENTLSYGLERVWTAATLKGSNDIAIGCDEGIIVLRIGREIPPVSMDTSGKIIWAKHNEIQSANTKTSIDSQTLDGMRISLPVKELGHCEIYPQSLQHSPSGRFVVVCGDGEYIIYTALAWRNKDFGKGLDFAWGVDASEFAVRETANKIQIFKNFKKEEVIKPIASAETIFGGTLLGVRCGTFLGLYDWETHYLVRRIDVQAKNVYWSENGKMVVISCADCFYVLKYNNTALLTYIEQGLDFPDDGIEEAFEFVQEVNENIYSGSWASECFLYTNSNNRLNYFIGNEAYLIANLEVPLYILGYLANDGRVYLADRDMGIVSFALSLDVIDYQSAIIRHDFEAAACILPKISMNKRDKVAKFLETQNLKDEALKVTTDIEHKFDLALQLQKLDICYEIASTQNSDAKWNQLGELATNQWQFEMAERCYLNSNNLSSLLLLYSSLGKSQDLSCVASRAMSLKLPNLAFTCFFIIGELNQCFNILMETKKFTEASLFARAYLPSKTNEAVEMWKHDLRKKGHKAADLIGSPLEHPNEFVDYQLTIEMEEERKHAPSNLDRSPEILKKSMNSRFAEPEMHQDGMSDNHSHVSMDVNTTGTESMKGEDLDDIFSAASFDGQTALMEKLIISDNDLNDLLA